MWFNPGVTIQASQSPPISKISRISKPVNSEVLIVDCYTPNGQLFKVEARDAEHAAFLIRMNPKPIQETYS